MSYEIYRFTSNVTVGSASGVYAGFVSKVDGEVGIAFIDETAEGAMVGLYQISVDADPAAHAFVRVDKTTKQNKGTVRLSATENAPANAKAASALKSDTGFDAIVEAVDGTKYYMLNSSKYVVVNSSRFSYTLSVSQSIKAKEFFQNVSNYLSNHDWRSEWAKVPVGTGVDVLVWVRNNIPAARGLMDECVSILGEVPVVTYELSVKNGIDNEAPEIVKDNVSVISMGNKIKAECFSAAVDNFFVTKYEWSIIDTDKGTVVASGFSNDETIRPDKELADDDYTFRIRAWDYAGNTSDWFETAVTIDTVVYVDGKTINESKAPVPISSEQEVEKGYDVDMEFIPEYSGNYNLYLTGIDDPKAKLTLTIYEVDGEKMKKLKSKSVSVSNSDKGIGSYLFDIGVDEFHRRHYLIRVTANSKMDTSFTISVQGEAYDRANMIIEDTWANMKKIDTTSLTPDMQVAVNPQYDEKQKLKDLVLVGDEWVGFSDRNDVREISITVASKMTIALTADNKATLSLYQEKKPGTNDLKKVKSVSVGNKGGTSAISNVLLEAATYFIVVEAPSHNKGVNANYKVTMVANETEFFEKANPGEYNKNYLSAEAPAEGWVGFGGAVNSFKFKSTSGGAYNFEVSDAASSVQLYVTNDKGKVVRKVTTNNKTGKASTGLIMLNAGESYVAVESKQAKKGVGTDYKLTVVDQYEYNKGNNTMNTASVLTNEGVQGIVSQSVDSTDWYNISAISKGLEIESLSGTLTASFYDSTGTKLLTETVKKGNSVEVNPSKFGASFVNIEATGKKENLYMITVA